MRKLLLVSLSAFVGAVLAITLPQLPVHAGPPPARETRVPGDTNCDGKLDLSDAVFTLNYLFVGTTFPPCPLADPPELVARIAELEGQLAQKSVALDDAAAQLADKDAKLAACQTDLEGVTAQLASLQATLAEKNAELGTCQGDLSDCGVRLSECGRRPLPATGLKKCYDTDGFTVVPCDIATCLGQDGFYQAGCPAEGRFVDNGDGSVTDICTGLMWQKNTADVNGDGQVSYEGDALMWCQALTYCDNLSLAGHDDWRLPNARELLSIVDYGRQPATDPVFGTLFGQYYWSSTTYVVSPGNAVSVDLAYGQVTGYFEGLRTHFRAVRNAP